MIAPYGQAEVVDFRLARHGALWTWPMGLDANGRDMFSRMVYGARVSLVVGVLAQAIVLLIGVPIGALRRLLRRLHGQRPHAARRCHLRDAAAPDGAPLRQLLGPGVVNIFLAIGLVGWVTEARLVQGAVSLAPGAGVRQRGTGRWGRRGLHHS